MYDQTHQTDDDSPLLAGLLALAGSEGMAAGWAAEDLAFIWRHQLAAPLVLDLGGIAPDAEATVTALCGSQSIQSLADLLGHAAPPLGVLRLLKDFSRVQRSQADSAYPSQIAIAMYFAAIALALARLECRITAMDDTRLGAGLEWMLRQVWLDQGTRELAGAALQKLRGP